MKIQKIIPRLLVVAALVLFTGIPRNVYSEDVSKTRAIKLAEKFYASINKYKTDYKMELIKSYTFFDEEGNTHPGLYVLKPVNQKGFVIIAGNDQVSPILGYSKNGNVDPESAPENYQSWIKNYLFQIRQLRPEETASPEKRAEWERLETPGKSLKNLQSVTPLCTTKWDQSPYYNDLCPYDYSRHANAVTGCVATAMAQVMKYHNHPEQGTGMHSYYDYQFGEISANFASTTYLWDQMPNQLESENNPVATLMFHCGVSVEMEYGVDGSGISSLDIVADALKSYFSYASTTQFVKRDNYTDNAWIELIRGEINNHRPVEYAGMGVGAGHAWVCDGYEGNHFHMNWGWSGYYDGYFLLDDLNPDGTGTGGGSGEYNYNQQAIIGVEPPGGGDVVNHSLEHYSNMYVTPDPIPQNAAFDVVSQIINNGDEAFVGDIGALLFNTEEDLLETVYVFEDQTLEPGYYYDAVFHSDGVNEYPGRYRIGIFAKSGEENWQIISGGDYIELLPVVIEGEDNDIVLYAETIVSPRPIVLDEPFTVWVDPANMGESTFNGSMSIDFYTSEGDHLEELSVIEGISLEGGFHFTDGLSFSCPALNYEMGSYMIALWNKPDGGEWQLVDAGDFQNPIRVDLMPPQMQKDPYEDNNSEELSYTIPLTFSRGQALMQTEGTNLHSGYDVDYYKVVLPPGYDYGLIPKVYDSYNGGKLGNYTVDVNLAYKNGDSYSDFFDDIVWDRISVLNGGTVYFYIQSFFFGNTGTYALELNVSRVESTSVNCLSEDDFNVFPNPASSRLFLDYPETTGESIDIKLHNMQGQLLLEKDVVRSGRNTCELDITPLPNGVYYMQIQVDGFLITKKIIINK